MAHRMAAMLPRAYTHADRRGGLPGRLWVRSALAKQCPATPPHCCTSPSVRACANVAAMKRVITRHRKPKRIKLLAVRNNKISQKSILTGFSANSLDQTFALLYASAGLQGARSHSGRRTFLTSVANKGTSIHILKTLASHRSIQTTAAYLYRSPTQLKAAVELV
jgi:integrase